MASKPPIQCPICREELSPDEKLADHLVAGHTKRKLATFIVAEEEAKEDQDIS